MMARIDPARRAETGPEKQARARLMAALTDPAAEGETDAQSCEQDTALRHMGRMDG